jgi:hypothetical protein
MQQAAKERGGGYGAAIEGLHLLHYSVEDDVWDSAAVVAYQPGHPPLHTLLYDSSRQLVLELAREIVVFRSLPPLDAQRAEQARRQLVGVPPEARMLALPRRVTDGQHEAVRLVASSLQRVVPATR